ncbi:hypothetical protein TNCV_4176131 [Trichonephila clavipes]|nr:hypothetical protein TNCV_4176131 [Trichonephila clavipes]
MSARRCLGMTGNHNFPCGSKFFLHRISSMNLNSSSLDELLKSFNFARFGSFFCSITRFILVVTAKNLVSPFPLPLDFSKEHRRHYASYQFFILRPNLALEVGGPIWQAFPKDPLDS